MHPQMSINLIRYIQNPYPFPLIFTSMFHALC